jgi:hypothetical protein
MNQSIVVRAAPSIIGGGVAKKRSWWKKIRSHSRRLSLEILNIFINHDWLFWLIGAINKHIRLLEAVFLVYPANEKYALAYVYRRRLPKVMWNPWLCGLLWQDKKVTLMFCISATNGQFTNPENVENLKRAAERMEKLRQLFSVKRKTFAGILPGILHSKEIIHDAPEADITAVAVSQAIDLVKIQESLGDHSPIIILGGKGFIGRRVVRLLNKQNIYSIDSLDGQDSKDWPSINERQGIVVNITLSNALKDYLDVILPGMVVINEVYPEPTLEILQRLREKNCKCYHIVGVKAFALPPFPAAYRGAIPCCAAWPSPKMRVVVRKLN